MKLRRCEEGLHSATGLAMGDAAPTFHVGAADAATEVARSWHFQVLCCAWRLLQVYSRWTQGYFSDAARPGTWQG